VPKIMLEIDNFEYEVLQKFANEYGLNVEDMGTKLLNSQIVALMVQKGTASEDKINITPIFDKLKYLMSFCNITQNDISTSLKIAQSSVSFSFKKQSKTSVLGKILSEKGVDSLLIEVFKRKHETMKCARSKNNWTAWKKIIFAYLVSSNNASDEKNLIKAIASLDNNVETILLKAEEEGLG